MYPLQQTVIKIVQEVRIGWWIEAYAA